MLIISMLNLLFGLYQKIISPALHFISMSTVVGGCRFYPTCSEYCKQTINKKGLTLTSILLCAKRLGRCQPFNFFLNKKNHGYDPVD